MSEVLLDFDFAGYVGALSPRQRRRLRLVIDQDAELPNVPKPFGRAAAVVPVSVVGLSTFRGFAPDAFRGSATDILGAEDDLAALERLNG